MPTKIPPPTSKIPVPSSSSNAVYYQPPPFKPFTHPSDSPTNKPLFFTTTLSHNPISNDSTTTIFRNPFYVRPPLSFDKLPDVYASQATYEGAVRIVESECWKYVARNIQFECDLWVMGSIDDLGVVRIDEYQRRGYDLDGW